MALAEIDNGLMGRGHGYAATLHKAQAGWIERIVKQVRETPASVILQAGVSLGPVGELSNDLLNQRTAIANFGRGQVTAELGRRR